MPTGTLHDCGCVGYYGYRVADFQPIAPNLLSHYASQEYRLLLCYYGFVQPMSRKGDGLDNAPMESFFKSLKVERCYAMRYESRDHARLDIVNWIEGFYNRQRLHSALDYKTPVQFEINSFYNMLTVR